MISSRVNKSSSGFKPKFKPRAPARPAPPPIVEKEFEILPAKPPEAPHSPSPTLEPQQEVIEEIIPQPNLVNEPMKNIIMKPQPILQQNVQQTTDTPISLLKIHSLIYSKFKQGKVSSSELRRKQSRKAGKEAQKEVATEDGNNVTSVTAASHAPAPPSAAPESFGPRLIIVDGKVTVDKSSLQVEVARPHDEPDQGEAVEETGGRHITSASFGKKYTKISWNKDAVKHLYEGLSYFGTDFSVIAVYIRAYCEHLDTLNQRHVRLRFAYENKSRADAVTEAFRNKKIPGPDVMEKMKLIAPLRESSVVETANIEQEEPRETSRKRKGKQAGSAAFDSSSPELQVPEQIVQPEIPKMPEVRPVVGVPFSFGSLTRPSAKPAAGGSAPKRFNPSVLAKKRKI